MKEGSTEGGNLLMKGREVNDGEPESGRMTFCVSDPMGLFSG